uniref:Uncharacterized protein n=1 Tax=Eutreptiella gymnastica TaxID=73025 RepID=A0A7S4LJA1_9EUGL
MPQCWSKSSRPPKSPNMCVHIPASCPFEGIHAMSPMVTAALSDLSPTIATNSPTTMTLVCKNARQKKTQVARALAECIHILQSCTEPKIPKGLQVREIDERDPRIGLHGQKGLFATEVLPSFFIVGPYKSWVGMC